MDSPAKARYRMAKLKSYFVSFSFSFTCRGSTLPRREKNHFKRIFREILFPYVFILLTIVVGNFFYLASDHPVLFPFQFGRVVVFVVIVDGARSSLDRSLCVCGPANVCNCVHWIKVFDFSPSFC